MRRADRTFDQGRTVWGAVSKVIPRWIVGRFVTRNAKTCVRHVRLLPPRFGLDFAMLLKKGSHHMVNTVSTSDQPREAIPTDNVNNKLTLASPDDPKMRILVSGADRSGRHCLIDMLVPPATARHRT